jgi:myo-inositol catabolism protein IolC
MRRFNPDGRLYILAMDHRGSFEKDLLGLTGPPSDADHERIADAKQVIFEGFLQARARGAPREAAGILVDEQFGAAVAGAARAEGAILAMPVERSGEREFKLEYGDDFGAHIEAFDPDFSKVLVRYNPQAEDDSNGRQLRRLAELSTWLRGHDRQFLFELLVPPTQEELEEIGGVDSYDHRLRPQLVIWAIAEMQAAGVEPDVWKIEGIDRRDDCERISAQARSGGRDDVRCVVLGRGADQARVDHWLREGARASGFCGFAIGRTIWYDGLKAMLAGEADRSATAAEICRRYLAAIEVYETAAAGSASQPA